MRIATIIIFTFVSFNGIRAQVLPAERSVDWSFAGIKDSSTIDFLTYKLSDFEIVGDGLTPNDDLLQEVLSQLTNDGSILLFDAGDYVFNKPLHLKSNTILKGKGADLTNLIFDLGGNLNAIDVRGALIRSDTFWLNAPTFKNEDFLLLSDAKDLFEDDWLRMYQIDEDLVTSSWANGTVGQIVQIKALVGDTIFLRSPLRTDFNVERKPYALRIEPVSQVGIECLKIKRLDETAPMQTSSVHFSYAVNSWVRGIESENCTFAHVEAEYSSNIKISNSYFHHAFDYGGGGRAYGVMLHLGTNECLVENNVFEHLRHSMIVQAGANGNVFAYNYSFDPFWSSFPSNSAGDMVIHGNYVHHNLFEQNIVQNIVIDNSHGPNGPHNTFFRNRAESFGIFFSADNSPSQNLIGNEIPNEDFPFILVNYTIQGNDHFIYGNNNKGIIAPSGTEVLNDLSYYYKTKPDFIPEQQWANIGTPNTINKGDIPSYTSFNSTGFISESCTALVSELNEDEFIEPLFVFPNPVRNKFYIKDAVDLSQLYVFNGRGELVYQKAINKPDLSVDCSAWEHGLYFIRLCSNDFNCNIEKIIKSK